MLFKKYVMYVYKYRQYFDACYLRAIYRRCMMDVPGTTHRVVRFMEKLNGKLIQNYLYANNFMAPGNGNHSFL